MGEFPASWVLLPVSEAVRNVTLTDKKIPQKNYLPSGKFPVFDQGQDYVGGYTDDDDMVVDCELPAIVFGDHTRVVKLVSTAFAPGADGVKVLQPSACILPKLLEHFVRYLVTKIPNNGYARHYQHLAKSLLPIPPLPEQHRIVAKIEELFSELDQGVASLKTAREQLKVYRQSLLKNAFEGKLTAAWRAAHRNQLETAAALQLRIARERQARHQQQLADWQTAGQPGPKPKPPKPLPPLTAEELAELPELPAGWGWMKYGDLCSLVRNGISAKPEGDSGTPIFRISAVRPMCFDMVDIRYIDNSSGDFDSYCLQRGDIVFTRYNGSRQYVGVCAEYRSDEKRFFPDKLVQTRVSSRLLLTSFLEKALNSGASRGFVESKIRTTAGQSGVSGEDIKNIPVPVCCFEEQLEIVQELESKLSEADQLDQILAIALQQADALRQSILKKAFCGQLVKQDKNEEPASALLERIRAARATSPAKGRQAKMVSKPLTNC